MIFRNLTMFRFPRAVSLADLAVGLSECALKPVGPMELSSRGFIAPYGRDATELVVRAGRSLWLTVGGEDRLLPGSVINDAVVKKLAAIEQAEGRKPGGRTRKRIKDDIIVDLLPRAFVRPSRIDTLIDLDLGIVAVDTSSRKAAENVVSEIRRALGSFPALPLNAEVAPSRVMTFWVDGEPLPEGLTVGDECELRAPLAHGAVIKCHGQELDSDEIREHLAAGKQVTRLALNLDDHVSFVLGEDLVVRKFKLLDGAVDTLENTEREDLRAELDARFALMAAELKRLFAVLDQALQLSTVEG